MPKLTLKAATKTYLIAILLLGVLISPLPQFALAIILLALQLYTSYKPPKPSLNLALLVATMVLFPLTLVSIAGNLFSGLFILPAIYLLDRCLLENASSKTSYHSEARKATPTLTTLSTTLLMVLVLSFVLFNETLAITTLILLMYFSAILTYYCRKLPKHPLTENKVWNRILVGRKASSRMKLTAETDLPLFVSLTSVQPWLCFEPSNFTLKPKGQTEVSLSYTPPLAGPSKLQIQASAVDPRGLIEINQTLEPVDLHVIPKAKYAKWLAKKYLEQTASISTSTTAAIASGAVRAAKRGVEYYASRLYQPGDRLKDVDWKHTFMLDELIIKDFAGAHSQPNIIVANLAVKDAQEADKLTYNLVMTALTSATESLPSGLAAYNKKAVIEATVPSTPRETLKEALKVTEKITIDELPQKVLQPMENLTLKRAIEGLRRTKAEEVKSLAELLELESEATELAAKIHPATQALTKCVKNTPPPAMITVASSINYDSDALLRTLGKLRKKGYSTVIASK